MGKTRRHAAKVQSPRQEAKRSKVWIISEAWTLKSLSLVPDVAVPPKFKIPKFEKYDGTKCTENHLATYYHKMTRHVHNEDLLIHAEGIPRIA